MAASSSSSSSAAYPRTMAYPPSQCFDPSEMDSWLNYSPSASNMSRKSSHISSIASPASTIVGHIDVNDDHQTPVQPSHDYQRFRQTTGLPANSVAGLRSMSESSQGAVFADNYGTGLDDFSMPIFDGMGMGMGMGSMTGDLSFADTSADMATFLYPIDEKPQEHSVVDPVSILKQEEANSNVRFYPGMHQQQAALAKAQADAQMQAQQRQHQLLQQRQQARVEDPVYEETIARALAQIRQNSAMNNEDSMSGLSHMQRSRKDEEDMDEDERLLNSEEGKKLSSKERRQLRNKVSARAFRSRRKEYIGQLEAEISQKVTENTELKQSNRSLMAENDAFRALAQVFVAHPAFHTVVAEISRNPELSAAFTKMTGPMVAPVQQQQQQQRPQQRKDIDPYAAAQMGQIPIPQQPDTQHIGLAMMPDAALDFSTLNLGNDGSWAVPNMPAPSYQTPQVFAVTEIEVLDTPSFDTLSGKGESVLDRFAGVAEEKTQAPELPQLENKDIVAASRVEESAVVEYEFDEADEDVTLYANAKSSTVTSTTRPTSADLSSKPCLILRVISEASNAAVTSQLDALVAKLEGRFERLNAFTSSFGL